MATIELEAYVTEDGEVKFRLSPNEKKKPSHIKIKLGNVELEIEGDLENMQSQYLRTSTEFETGGDLENPPSVENDVAWTDEEIAEMMRSEPKTGAEIADSDVIGSWADKGIIDSVEFVEYLRRKSRERRKWQQGLVDTNILIDLLRGYAPAQAWIRTQQTLGLARIVYMELIEGAFNKIEQQRALKLLKQFEVIELSDIDFKWATEHLIKYQLSHSVGMMDCLIASTSYRLKLPLYTQNLKHMTPLLGVLAQKPY